VAVGTNLDGGSALAQRKRSSFGQRVASGNSYGTVLLLILVTYLLSVTVEKSTLSLVIALQVITVAVAIHVSRAHRGVRLAVNVVLGLACLVAIIYLFGSRESTLLGIVFATSSVLYFIAPFSILRAIVVKEEMDREAVVGAIAAYLLIGMFFAYLYLAVGTVGDDFFGQGTDASPADYFFFSFTTLTTTGYGNLVPASNPGQSFAVLEMLMGQLFLITAVGKVITAWHPAAWDLKLDTKQPSKEVQTGDQ
jgi:Ion channel